MARLWTCNGGDSGQTATASGSGISVVSSPTHGGSNAYSTPRTSGGVYYYKISSNVASDQTYYWRFWVYMASGTISATQEILTAYHIGNTANKYATMSVEIGTDGTLRLVHGSTNGGNRTAQIGSNSTALSATTWNEILVAVNVPSSGAGYMEAWLNGSAWVANSSVTFTGNEAYTGMLTQWGNPNATTGAQALTWDDIALNDNTGSAPDTMYPGYDTPSTGSIASATTDDFGRVSFTFTEGSIAPTSLKVYRATSSGGSFSQISSVTTTDNGSTWAVTDNRPQYGTPTISLGSTAYYKVKASGGTIAGDASYTGEVSATPAISKSNVELRVWSDLHTAMATQATREDTNHLKYPYCGYWLGAAAYVAAFYPSKTSEALTDFNTWWSFIKTNCINADDLLDVPNGSYPYIYTEHHFHLIRDILTCARLFQYFLPSDSTAQTYKADLLDYANRMGVAAFDHLSTASLTNQRGIGGDWPDSTGAATAWAASTNLGSVAPYGVIRRPTVANGHIYRNIRADASNGTTAGSEPTWPTATRGIVADNNLYWMESNSQMVAWAANTAIALGEVRKPTTGNGRTYIATTAGTTHATTEPTWPTTNKGTVTDGTVVWTETTANGTIFNRDYSATSPYAVNSAGHRLSDQDAVVAAAMALLCTTTGVTDFESGGSYRSTCLTRLGTYVDMAVSCQYTDGSGAYHSAPDDTAWLDDDSNYGSYTALMLGYIAKVLPGSYPTADAAYQRILTFLGSNYDTEPNISNGGTSAMYPSAGMYTYETAWRQDAYRAAGKTWTLGPIRWSSAMYPDPVYSASGQTDATPNNTTQRFAFLATLYAEGDYYGVIGVSATSDSWAWSDTAVGTRQFSRTASDSWAWSDSAASALPAYGRTTSDAWAWSDSAAPANQVLSRTTSDSWSFSSSASGSLGPVIDTWSWADIATVTTSITGATGLTGFSIQSVVGAEVVMDGVVDASLTFTAVV